MSGVIRTKLLEFKGGVHKCEVASGLDNYLPCPWPGCKHGTENNVLRKAVEDDHAYSFKEEAKNVPNLRAIKAEVYKRMQIATNYKWFWHFEREE
jgi:hypothetical protein